MLAEEWEREAVKLFPHDWLSLRGWGLLRLCHRGRLSPAYLRTACRSCECNCAGVCKIVAICAQCAVSFVRQIITIGTFISDAVVGARHGA